MRATRLATSAARAAAPAGRSEDEHSTNSYVQKPVDFGEFRETVRLIGSYWLTLNVTAPGLVRAEP